MTIWRPEAGIRVKVLGLAWLEARLLAAEVYDDRGRVKGVRPLGGSVEFGETTQAALHREFQEELGVEIEVIGEPIVMENLFVHEGVQGHEILFLYEVRLPPGLFGSLEPFVFSESDGTAATARWYALDSLDCEDGPALYPTGLKRRLLAQAACASR